MKMPGGASVLSSPPRLPLASVKRSWFLPANTALTAGLKLKAQVALLADGSGLTERADLACRDSLLMATRRLARNRPGTVLKAEPALAKCDSCRRVRHRQHKRRTDVSRGRPGARKRTKIGPRQWEPLLYICYSCLLKDAEYRPHLVATARRLLDLGADPNAHWLNRGMGSTARNPASTGQTGVNDCPALAEMLLQAGADPNDGESLYHSTELPSPGLPQNTASVRGGCHGEE